MLAAALLFLVGLTSLALPAPAAAGDAPALAQVATDVETPAPETKNTMPPDAAGKPKSLVAAWLDTRTVWLLGVMLVALAIAFVVGRFLRQQPEHFINPALVRTFNKRVQAYWMMCAILTAAVVFGAASTVILFGLVSFWALREFITMTPTRRSDHRALFWTFFILTPVQYLLVGLSSYKSEWLGIAIPNLYGIYSILIPVYASLFIPARVAFAGDHKRFLERIAKIQAGLMICVYSLSYAPAILYLRLKPSWAEEGWQGYWGYGDNPGSMAGLLFYFVLVAQLGDVFSYAWGKLLGRHVIAPAINASKTWEGLIGGTLSTTLVGALLWWVTPFWPWESALMAGAIALMGFAGGMTMSAIKRDRGVRDYGTLVTGHAGVLDRIDSICFAAPVFYHLTRVIFGA
jgi:phosphatidate cytidylyltransferase